jgi:hypothetical protein
MAKKLFTAIVFMQDNIEQPRKYRNIANLNSFRLFAQSIGASYYNLYDKSTKLFVERIYIKKGE